MLVDRPKKNGISLNLVPMINVIFLLLIFFLIAGTIAKQQVFKGALPEAAVSDALPDKGRLEIYIDEDNQVIVDGNVTSAVLAIQTLRLQLFIAPEQPVVLAMDAELPASLLTHWVGQLKEVGAKHILIQTLMEEGKK